MLWELFGTTNQLLAGLALLTVTVWLARRRRPTRAVLLPMLFMFAMTLVAMVTKIREFWSQEAWFVFGFALVLLTLAVWLIAEGIAALRSLRR